MATTTSTARALQSVPELQNGDHLSRDEFERRYHAMPAHKKAELIEGVVHMPSPVRFEEHSKPHFDLIGCLFHYKISTPGVLAGDNATVRLDLDNEPQPDVLLFVSPDRGGQAQVGEDGYVESAPEFVAEVAASSASYDLHTKRTVYRRNRVREYLVWRVLDKKIDWFVLRGSQYENLSPDADSIIRSEHLPGLWLDIAAVLAGDFPRVLSVIQQGLASPEHAAFVARMRER